MIMSRGNRQLWSAPDRNPATNNAAVPSCAFPGSSPPTDRFSAEQFAHRIMKSFPKASLNIWFPAPHGTPLAKKEAETVARLMTRRSPAQRCWRNDKWRK